jgi:CBS domain-containing protein
MRVRDVMSPSPKCCFPETPLEEVARLMLQNDCGCVPVCDPDEPRRLLGVITDRDIVVRAVAASKGCDTPVEECMTHPVLTISADEDLKDAIEQMEQNQLRRILVVESDQSLCGVLAQADIARAAPPQKVGALVQAVSERVSASSRQARMI